MQSALEYDEKKLKDTKADYISQGSVATHLGCEKVFNIRWCRGPRTGP